MHFFFTDLNLGLAEMVLSDLLSNFVNLIKGKQARTRLYLESNYLKKKTKKTKKTLCGQDNLQTNKPVKKYFRL